MRTVTASEITPLPGARVSCVWETECLLGEGPHWDRDENRLLFLDIKGGGLFVLPLEGDAPRRRWSVSDMLSSVVQDRDGELLGTTRHGVVDVLIPDDDTGTVQLTDRFRSGAGAPDNRFNDGKAGPLGTYWAGVMDDAETGEALGALRRYGPDGTFRTVLDDMLVPNGPAFTPDGRHAFFADSARRTLFRVATVSGSVPEPVLQFEDGLGYPDGMCCDAAGYLWIAFWDGGCIRRLSPDLATIHQIDFPVARPTSIAITPDRLYVTSARIGLESDELERAPLSGALFAVDGLAVAPGPDYRIGTD